MLIRLSINVKQDCPRTVCHILLKYRDGKVSNVAITHMGNNWLEIDYGDSGVEHFMLKISYFPHARLKDDHICSKLSQK